MLENLYKAIRKDVPPPTLPINGREYATVNLSPVTEPTASPFTVKSLSAVVDYFQANVDQLRQAELICHVEDHGTVSVWSALIPPFRQRECLITAKLDIDRLEFDEFLDAERFNIMLQSGFTEISENETDKALLLKYIGNVRSEVVSNVGDDGITQEMTIRASAARNENVKLPNPVRLRPFRTFNEVQQPASQFVFRAKDGPRFGLFTADNGAWRDEARQNIQAYLRTNIPDLTVIA